MSKRQTLATICDAIGDDPNLRGLECDGMTSVLSFRLSQERIDHKRCAGSVSFGCSILPVHYWLRCGPYTIDYRLRMWFRNGLPPHGVFSPSRQPVDSFGNRVLEYSTVERFAPMTNPVLYNILTLPWGDLSELGR